MNTTIIIPARYNSSRLPGKLLKKIEDKSILEWVYTACEKVKGADSVIIATDNSIVSETAERFGATVIMTSEDHKSGTSRCMEVASSINSDIIINVQGDEPFIDPSLIDRMINYFEENRGTEILTLCTPFSSSDEALDPNNVKLLKSKSDKALYFSRSVIPYSTEMNVKNYLKHIGIYGFRRSTLLALKDLPESMLEKEESLEQLAWLENDFTIHILEVEANSISIDTPEDLAKARHFAKGLSR